MCTFPCGGRRLKTRPRPAASSGVRPRAEPVEGKASIHPLPFMRASMLYGDVLMLGTSRHARASPWPGRPRPAACNARNARNAGNASNACHPTLISMISPARNCPVAPTSDAAWHAINKLPASPAAAPAAPSPARCPSLKNAPQWRQSPFVRNRD